MIKPITYTYKGRPLVPFGKRETARSLRRGRKIRSALFTGFCVIIILAAAAALAWWLSSCFRTDPVPKETVESETAELAKEETPAAATSAVSVPKAQHQSPAGSPSAAKNKTEQMTASTRLSESADRQAMRIYNAATTAFQKKDYESARKALRLLFEKIQLPPGHPLYDRSCAMLSDSSLAVYRSGSDPRDWKMHKVERGENLSRIARKYGTDVQTLSEVNELSGTALRIGQTIRIPQGSWRIRVERKNKRLLLDCSGRLFKIYPITVGPLGEAAAAGLYRIRRQQSPGRILFLGASSSAPAAVIHTGEDEPDPGRACFVMKPADEAELLLLVPEKTPAEILK